jgi:hypothetical protein
MVLANVPVGLSVPEEDPPASRPVQEEEESSDAIDYADLLAVFDDAADLDDSEAGDLDSTIRIHEVDEVGAADDEATSLDIGVLMDAGALGEAFADDDEAGPAELDLGSELDEPPPSVDADEESREDLGALVSDLPPMDALASDETYGTLDAGPLLDLEEDQAPVGREPWPALALDLPTGPRHAVIASEEGVTLAGDTVERWTRGGDREELATPGTLVTDLVPTPKGFLLATATGDVLALAGGTLGRVDAWRGAAGVGANHPVELRLAGGPDRHFLLTTGGVLLCTEDGGKTWTRVEVGGKALAISPEPPHWIAVEALGALMLARESVDDGFGSLAAAGAGRVLRKGCFLAARDPVVAIGRFGQGVSVSVDGGKTFSHVQGLASVTALTVGTLSDGHQVFAATFSAARNAASLHRVDMRDLVARHIGEVRAGDDDDDATVVALAFDDLERSLWAVGGFGLRVLSRPD